MTRYPAATSGTDTWGLAPTVVREPSTMAAVGGAWACICFRNSSNPAPNVGPEPNWWNTGIQVMKDGDSWIAHGPDFVNLQESPLGWGDTPNEAALDYQQKQTNHEQ